MSRINPSGETKQLRVIKDQLGLISPTRRERYPYSLPMLVYTLRLIRGRKVKWLHVGSTPTASTKQSRRPVHTSAGLPIWTHTVRREAVSDMDVANQIRSPVPNHAS